MARPRLAKSRLHDTPVTVRLNDELEAFFESEARIRDVPKAVIMREMLVERVNAIKAARRSAFQKTGSVNAVHPP